jgi:acyl-ACP thioesterase
VNFEGMPQRMRPGFINSYGEASGLRKVPGRIAVPEIPSNAKRTPWFIRRSDIDIVDHVNNAASWQALSEVATAPVMSASLIHHGPIEKFDEVTLVAAPGLMCLEVNGAVQVSCEFQQL